MTARYVIVATRARDRWFDLDSVRTEPTSRPQRRFTVEWGQRGGDEKAVKYGDNYLADEPTVFANPAGAPPLDWYLDDGVTPAPKERSMLGNARFLLGDVFEQIEAMHAENLAREALGDRGLYYADLIVSSPPFLALRSYLPADHPDKAKEIGSEPTPAAFIDTLLALVAALDRVLAPHGSLVFELGDTYAGSGGAGGDYDDGGFREAQTRFIGSAKQARVPDPSGMPPHRHRSKAGGVGGNGWPLDKSLTGIPTLFAWSLAYGRNLLTGEPSPAGQWRIRNVIPWCRPNPPVGALGDKWRPATSYVVVAARARDRFFDLDAVRTALTEPRVRTHSTEQHNPRQGWTSNNAEIHQNPAGAPPLDWYQWDEADEAHWDGPQWDDPAATHTPDDGMWVIPTAPYKGAHYATWPPELVRRLIECMCPREVCRKCGRPRRRITSEPEYVSTAGGRVVNHFQGEQRGEGVRQWDVEGGNPGHVVRQSTTLGWTDCGHGDFRRGLVLDPFVGSGTTMAVAVRHGRDAIGIDLDESNVNLARARMGNLPLEAPTVAEVWDEGSLFGSPADEIEDVELPADKPKSRSRFPAGYMRNDGRKTPQREDYGAQLPTRRKGA